MEQNEQQIKSHLQRISSILLINGGFLDNPGLYTGETGLAVFFFWHGFKTEHDCDNSWIPLLPKDFEHLRF